MLKPAILFKDHMVLQREKTVHIWGTADPGQEITVTVQGISASCLTDGSGSWNVELSPLRTSFSETIEIRSGKEIARIEDVQVGDVWLAAGQSNMEFFMRYDMDLETELAVCSNHSIRFFDYPEVSYPGQIDEADYERNFGFWRKACPKDLEWFSAVGYYFAKDIQHKYNVPVGIVGCNWGGTPACAWMSREAILKGGGKAWIDDYEAALIKTDPIRYEEQFRQDPASWKTDLFQDPFSDMLMKGVPFPEILRQLTGQEFDPAAMDFSAYMPAIGPKSEMRPSGLYKSMLSKIAPFALKGILFYQGESDGDTHPELYETMFPALIGCYRKLWQEELPFLFVQIAPFGRWMHCDGAPYPAIRKAQQLASETVPGTGMAVITDIGMELDIHPKKKQPVGHRLALQAMNKVYGESDVLCEAPSLSNASAEEGKLILYFENAGSGLYLAGHTPDGASTDPHMPGGLQIILNGQELDLSEVSAAACGNAVILSSPSFKEGISIEVMLGCCAWFRINLYNSADLPARPAHIRI